MATDWEIRESSESESTLVFQTLDWYTEDIINDTTGFPEYKVFVFGTDATGKSVSLRLDNYFPFFFIEIPEYLTVYTLKDTLGKSVKSVEIIKRKRFYGFENNKIRTFAKLSFYSYRSFRSLTYRINTNNVFMISGKPCRFELYESNIDPVLRLTHLQDILTAGWVKAEKVSYEDFYFVNWKNVKAVEGFDNRLADFRVMYFDIEACSDSGAFPNALKKSDRITQICCINKDKDCKKYLFNLGTIDPIEDTVVLQFSSEKKMLLSFATFIKETDPDIIVGYNIFGFDNGYLFERAKILEIEDHFNYQSKISTFRTDIVKKTLNNQQSGYNDWKMTRIVGRIHIDLLQVIKKDFKLESYKLNNVGEHFLKEGKDDVTPKEIFEAWNKTEGTREKRTRVGKYCVQDTMLCLKLFEKFAVLANHVEMAKVTRVPLEYLITRGQSIKVFSQISYETRKTGYLIPVLPRAEPSEEKFQGATVLEAKIGYYDRPVCGLDFKSLYPSCMISQNYCYSTIVLDPKFLNLPGFEYSTIECEGGESFSFIQNQPGVLKDILQTLWKNRDKTKKEMKASTDPFEKTVLDAKQLAIKVSMNSIYGFTGAVVGALPCLPIARSVTATGRKMIEQTCHLAVEKFQCEIVYGDSVTGDTPVLYKIGEIIDTLQIKDLFEMTEAEEYPQFKSGEPGLSEKQQSIPNEDIKIWTASGWKSLRRTIRHRCEKNIYRILTHTGLVDVTEDHSLLDLKLNQIKPSDVNIRTELFHSYPINLEKNIKLKDITDIFNNLNLVPEEYRLTFIQGFFVGDGSSGKYNCPSGLKYSWALNNADIYILETFQEWLNEIYQDFCSFKILDTIGSSGVYKLVPQGDIKFMVNEFDKFYSNRIKVITPEILNSEYDNQKWFFYGYYLADGYKCYNDKGKNIKITAKNKLSASQYFLLGRNLGFNVSLNDRSDKLNVFTLTFSQKLRKNEKSIKKIRNLGKINDYVYDLETEDGTFQAGIGQMIVKNTDSCYVILPVPVDPDGTLTTIFKRAEFVASEISSTFKKPVELEFEKIMKPFVLFSKKRYSYIEWTNPLKGDDEISSKGTVLSRRDNAPIVKETIETVLNSLMFENNLEKSVSQAGEYIDKLLKGEVPIKKLILSKTLRNDYKGFEKKITGENSYVWIRSKENKETGKIEKTEECPSMAQVALVEKMRSRDPNVDIHPGDRVPFVYIDIGDPKALSAQKVEDPKYVVENNVPIDYLYYYIHQLQSPLEQLFDILIGKEKTKELLFGRKSYLDAKKNEKITIGDAKRKKDKNKDIRGFFQIKST